MLSHLHFLFLFTLSLFLSHHCISNFCLPLPDFFLFLSPSFFLFFPLQKSLNIMNLSKWKSWRKRNLFRRKEKSDNNLKLGKWTNTSACKELTGNSKKHQQHKQNLQDGINPFNDLIFDCQTAGTPNLRLYPL